MTFEYKNSAYRVDIDYKASPNATEFWLFKSEGAGYAHVASVVMRRHPEDKPWSKAKIRAAGFQRLLNKLTWLTRQDRTYIWGQLWGQMKVPKGRA